MEEDGFGGFLNLHRLLGVKLWWLLALIPPAAREGPKKKSAHPKFNEVVIG